MSLLKSGQVGQVTQQNLKEIRQDIVSRWEDLGFLDGLQGNLRENVACLYENQASQLMQEATAQGAEGSFETVVFPIVRRVFSRLLANDIVSVQALNLPIGRLYYFIPKTGSSSFSSDEAGINPDNNYRDLNLYDSFYGEDGLFDQSKGQTDKVITGSTDGVLSAGTIVIENETYRYDRSSPNGYASAGATSINADEKAIIKMQVPLDSFRLDNVDDREEFLNTLEIKKVIRDNAGNITSQESLDFHLPVQKYSEPIMASDGTMYVWIAAPENSSLDLDNIEASIRDYEDLELNDNMGEVSFELDHVTVEVTERKLRAQWSPELAQDVSAFHNIDAEAELTSLLSEQIAAEIDREILRDLRRAAAWRLTWDYKGGTNRTINTSDGFYTQKDWNQTLITAINQLSAQIHKSTLRGGANWIVVSAEISAIFDDLEYFHVSSAAPEEDTYNMGIERVGTLNGRYTVYRDPYFPSDTLLMGHKGQSLLDTGYIYAPYVPMQLTPTMYNPFTFAPVKGILTRYATKVVNNRFYGVIKCRNIVDFNLSALR